MPIGKHGSGSGVVASRKQSLGRKQQGAVWHFLLGMFIPCLVVVYLLILEQSSSDLNVHFKALRAMFPETADTLKHLTNWGNIIFYPVYAAIFLLGLLWRKPGWKRFALAYLVVQLLISFALVRVLKIGLGCPRPDVDGLCLAMSWDSGHHSLPSGHTVEITGAAMPLAMRARSVLFSLALGLFVALMAYSRVFLGWHHPADVGFGLAFGGLAAWLIHSYGK